jgi:hypothetical protein
MRSKISKYSLGSLLATAIDSVVDWLVDLFVDTKADPAIEWIQEDPLENQTK